MVGKRTLEDIIAEAKADEKQFNIRVRTKLRGSYSHHYRRGLPKLLKAVTFGSSNEAFQPVEAALRRARRLFINRDNLRAAIRTVVNATLEARDTSLWGPGTACASDSRKFGSWSANFMTEWHQRYGGAGIMVYWHVERKNVCIYSQVRSTTDSEPVREIRVRHEQAARPRPRPSTGLRAGELTGMLDLHGAAPLSAPISWNTGYMSAARRLHAFKRC